MIERIAFVSPPGCSAFMGELLDVVADSVQDAGFPVLRHGGTVTDIDDGVTGFVVVPHEYVAVAGRPPEAVLARMIALGVEHPGTATFEASLATAYRFGARVEINAESVTEVRHRGVACERFELGYSPRWDRRRPDDRRDIDVVYLGTADPRRLALLASIGPALARHRCELFVPPHEPMTQARPDFLLAEQKWDVLARSRILLNLHRDESVAFEWVRCLEAICNGAVVLTEASPDFEPLVAGESIVVGTAARMGALADALLREPERCEAIAATALEVAMHGLDPAGSARRLVDIAKSLPAGPAVRIPLAPAGRQREPDDQPMAVWIPTVRDCAPTPGRRGPAGSLAATLPAAAAARRPAVDPSVWLDVVCAGRPGDGPLGATLESLHRDGVSVHADLGEGREVRDTPGRGLRRNALLAASTAELVLVIDPGDTVFPTTLQRIRERFEPDADGNRADVVWTMARLGTGLVNVLVPEPRRLCQFDYLTRGYVVHRDWLERLGGFTEDPALDDLVDHDFWLRSARADARTVLIREVGMQLWPQLRVERVETPQRRPRPAGTSIESAS
ncbi:MAG: hypothetical protein QOE97_3905 [Pseudonocardiales bacterium]|nr:hypothetical protein [Pseudonocardiales bacterium]